MKRFSLYSVILLCLFAISSCDAQSGRSHKNRRGETPEQKNDTIPEDISLKVKPKVNVYIENSGSMDGYVKGINEFKDAIGRLLVELKYHYDEENMNIFFICNDKNDKSIQVTQTAIGSDIANFATDIDVKWRDLSRSRGHNTNLNNVFAEILKRTDNDCISILISDCIYSIGKGSTIDLLNHEKSTTYDAFLTKAKTNQGDLSTTIIKMKSKFDGKYYPFTGDKNAFSYKGELPYYICVFANKGVMADFNKNIDLEQIKGFENKYIISKEKIDNIYYSILISSFKKGRFKPQHDGSKDCVHGIQDVKIDKRSGENLTFAIAMNLNDINVDESYLCNADNFLLSDEDFAIVEIKELKKGDVVPSDWKKISGGNPTHVMILRVTSKKIPTTTLSISLKKQMPKWIEESSILDDTKTEYIMNGKSFGLEYWITGISDAYRKLYPEDKCYFEITINIKK